MQYLIIGVCSLSKIYYLLCRLKINHVTEITEHAFILGSVVCAVVNSTFGLNAARRMNKFPRDDHGAPRMNTTSPGDKYCIHRIIFVPQE
jgi:hypothetical protein